MKNAEFELHPVGDQGVMLRFGDKLSDETHEKVLAADQVIRSLNIVGFTESIPSYTSLFVGYDPIITDLQTVVSAIGDVTPFRNPVQQSQKTWTIPACYDEEFGLDIEAVASKTGLSREAVIEAHLSGIYKVFMYGFAPGYAYTGGVPESIQLPRKSEPVRDVPAGSILVAGEQCLITTLKMPTGWWIIGRSPFQMLQPRASNPFPVSVGDSIRFKRISRSEYDQPKMVITS